MRVAWQAGVSVEGLRLGVAGVTVCVIAVGPCWQCITACAGLMVDTPACAAAPLDPEPKVQVGHSVMA